MSTDQHLKGGSQEDGARLCLVVPSAGQRGTGHRLEPREFHLNVRKKFCAMRLAEPWNRTQRGGKSPLEITQTRPDAFLCSCYRELL